MSVLKKLFYQGRTEDALQMLEAESSEHNLSCQMVKSRILLRNGEFASALSLLNSIYLDAKRRGIVDVQIDSLIIKSTHLVNIFAMSGLQDLIDKINSLYSLLRTEDSLTCRIDFDYHFLISFFNYHRGRIREALRLFEECLDISSSVEDGGYSTGYSHRYIASVLGHLGEYQKALNHRTKELSVFEKLGNEFEIARTTKLFASIYYSMGNLEKALQFYFETLEYFRNHPNKYEYSLVVNSIGNSYLIEGKYDIAMQYYKQALELNLQCQIPEEIACSFHNIGIIYSKIGRFQEARKSYNKALAIRKQYGTSLQIASNLSLLGNLESKIGDIDRSINEVASRSIGAKRESR